MSQLGIDVNTIDTQMKGIVYIRKKMVIFIYPTDFKHKPKGNRFTCQLQEKV